MEEMSKSQHATEGEGVPVVEATNTSREVVLYSMDTPNDAPQLSWNADWAWTVRLLSVLVEGVRQRFLTAWFSTLGGAYSALGDTMETHAEKARRVSWQQLALANVMGDSMLVARCKLYIAYSLIQRGKYKKAAKLIREQYCFATQKSLVYDQKLVDMCLAGWARLPGRMDYCNNSTMSVMHNSKAIGFQDQRHS